MNASQITHPADRAPGIVFVLAAFCLLGVAALPVSASGADRKIDTRLARVLESSPESLLPVWVTFVDKGTTDAAELSARLAASDAMLTPRSRARRIRAGVHPLVDVLDLPVHEAYLDALRHQGLRPYGVSRWFNHAAVRTNAASVEALAALPFVRGLSLVERAEPTPRLPVGDVHVPARRSERANATPGSSTIDYGSATAQASQINVPALHDSGYTGTGVLVAVLDAGFNGHETHEALQSLAFPPGFKRDFVDGDTTMAGSGHGTYVLGTIAGNKPGTYVGTGFGADFALARTEQASSETRMELVYWQQGAEWADSLGADIITSSLGYSLFDNPSENYSPDSLDGHTTIVSRAAQIAASKGILLVNSAGNDGQNPSWNGKIVAPADVHGDSLIAVGAVDSDGIRAGFSSMGPTADGRIKPDLMARGVSLPVVSSSSPTGYFNASGTSFSGPITAGLAACLVQGRPTWSATTIIQALRATADRASNPDTMYGYGIPNGLAALKWQPGTLSVPLPTGRPRLVLVGPNPFRSEDLATVVRFALNREAVEPEPARVQVFDGQGRAVRTLWSGLLRCGEWVTASWDGRSEEGGRTNPGLYFISLKVGGNRQSVRVVSLP